MFAATAAMILFAVLLRLSFSTIAAALRRLLFEPLAAADAAPWIGPVVRLAAELEKAGASDCQPHHVYLFLRPSSDPETGLCSCWIVRRAGGLELLLAGPLHASSSRSCS